MIKRAVSLSKQIVKCSHASKDAHHENIKCSKRMIPYFLLKTVSFMIIEKPFFTIDCLQAFFHINLIVMALCSNEITAQNVEILSNPSAHLVFSFFLFSFNFLIFIFL